LTKVNIFHKNFIKLCKLVNVTLLWSRLYIPALLSCSQELGVALVDILAPSLQMAAIGL